MTGLERQPTNPAMVVIKRDGSGQPFKSSKLEKRIENLLDLNGYKLDSRYISIDDVVKKV
jgi:hypothetical protein